jgi:hypothetical protein
MYLLIATSATLAQFCPRVRETGLDRAVMDIEDDDLREASSKSTATLQEDSNGADACKEMACSLDSACRLNSALEFIFCLMFTTLGMIQQPLSRQQQVIR